MGKRIQTSKERIQPNTQNPITDRNIGELVQYYRNGWYTGHIVEVFPRKKVVKIRPIGPKGVIKDAKKFRFEDVKLV